MRDIFSNILANKAI